MLEITIEFHSAQTEEERIDFMDKSMNEKIEETGKIIKEIIYRKIIGEFVFRDWIASKKWQGKGKHKYSYIELPVPLANVDMVILRME